MADYGLIGKSLVHSFSKEYFTQKFKDLGLNHTYHNFEIEILEDIDQILKVNINLRGLNITNPYKKQALDICDKLSKEAKEIGAVNCIEFRDQQLIGHNTDWIGFSKSLEKWIPQRDGMQALILGSGGASNAVAFALRKLQIGYGIVSSSGKGDINYSSLTESDIRQHQLIINTTPLGTYPSILERAPLPYTFLGTDHYLFDLVYNPTQTVFLKAGIELGCKVKNGHEMLVNQAEESWTIWNT